MRLIARDFVECIRCEIFKSCMIISLFVQLSDIVTQYEIYDTVSTVKCIKEKLYCEALLSSFPSSILIC
jgi:hypothetical protein